MKKIIAFIFVLFILSINCIKSYNQEGLSYDDMYRMSIQTRFRVVQELKYKDNKYILNTRILDESISNKEYPYENSVYFKENTKIEEIIKVKKQELEKANKIVQTLINFYLEKLK